MFATILSGSLPSDFCLFPLSTLTTVRAGLGSGRLWNYPFLLPASYVITNFEGLGLWINLSVSWGAVFLFTYLFKKGTAFHH